LVVALAKYVATQYLMVASGYCTVQLQPSIDHQTSMQLIPDATKTVILQPYIGVGQGLIPTSVGVDGKPWFKEASNEI
jgi:hypothetical protein